jgi:hypothetical protein
MGDSDIDVFIRENFIEKPLSLGGGFQKKGDFEIEYRRGQRPGLFRN